MSQGLFDDESTLRANREDLGIPGAFEDSVIIVDGLEVLLDQNHEDENDKGRDDQAEDFNHGVCV